MNMINISKHFAEEMSTEASNLSAKNPSFRIASDIGGRFHVEGVEYKDANRQSSTESVKQETIHEKSPEETDVTQSIFEPVQFHSRFQFTRIYKSDENCSKTETASTEIQDSVQTSQEIYENVSSKHGEQADTLVRSIIYCTIDLKF